MADILTSPIHTYAPMQEGGGYIAIIKGVAFYFKADTATGAKKKARDFVLVETLKVRGKEKFPPELLDAAIAATKRAEERRKAKVPAQFRG